MLKISPLMRAEHDAHALRGIFFYAGALLLFSCLDAIAKFLTKYYPAPLVSWARYLSQFALMTAILAPMLGMDLLRTKRTRLVVLRSSCLAVVTGFNIATFARLPLAESTSIFFIAPLLVALLARPVLQERIGALRWAAVIGGFVGVLLIVRPGGDLDTVGVAYALLAASFYAVYQLLSRVLGGREHAAALLYYSALIGSVAFGVLAPWYWEGPAPSPLYYVLFVSLGVLGGVGHFLLTEAFSFAPASLLAPITYLQLVWAGLLGWLVFGDFPDGISLVGMAIIAVSGIAVSVYGRRRASYAVTDAAQ